ncbi:protein of unknown function [Candidatus Filomicrobium marinum]|uniref:Uncharacterized protein n=1 Tax=Candidatus Filomicrobium marinum TaxID=1608628 RepID=A0A0D6JGE2_9HYPH|nr:protein of unknown function [Candidatus Filomicrobium marinum]CPR19969.1 protein of unknown function [Candidatus Filomicrobium marinum]
MPSAASFQAPQELNAAVLFFLLRKPMIYGLKPSFRREFGSIICQKFDAKDLWCSNIGQNFAAFLQLNGISNASAVPKLKWRGSLSREKNPRHQMSVSQPYPGPKNLCVTP